MVTKHETKGSLIEAFWNDSSGQHELTCGDYTYGFGEDASCWEPKAAFDKWAQSQRDAAIKHEDLVRNE